LLLFLAVFADVIALNVAASRCREQLAIGLLFGLGLLLGLAVAPVISEYANSDPAALWQAAGATALLVAACGAYGYATRRDLSSDRRFDLPRRLQHLPVRAWPLRRRQRRVR
jgi:FtsH-binding integral membrane protein